MNNSIKEKLWEDIWTTLNQPMDKPEGWCAGEMTEYLANQGKLPEGWTVIDIADLMIERLGPPNGEY